MSLWRKLVVYRTTDKRWRYRVVARNGRIVFASEESYAKRSYCIQKGRMVAPRAKLVIEYQ